MKPFKHTLLAGILFVGLGWTGFFSSEVRAQVQAFYPVTEVTPHDINLKVLGPQTTEVVMDGYRDRNQYHETRYVSVNTGSDATGDGSQTKPWSSIAHALEQISDARLSRRYALLVASGAYAEGELFLKEFVHLYGGFDPASWQRDIRKHVTTIDGKGGNRLFTAASHSKIDGFQLVNGEVRGNGGAILCNGTSPVISNNTFRNNRTLGPEPWDPEFIHEIANDGGAVAAINGGAPLVLSNLFFENTTEIGRGGAIGAHNHSAPRILYNVFIDNAAGTNDPKRSSDGGAISSSFYSDADIFYNVIVNNKSLSRNDGGGIFSEMWSSLHIAGNIILGNHSDDDGGGIYLSGSVHHYITEHEPKLPSERYFNYLVGNIIAGNTLTSGGVSGAFRFTYFTRLLYKNNISFSNHGGLDFRRTDVIAEDNLVFENMVIRDNSTAKLKRNHIFGEVDSETEQDLRHNKVAGLEKPDVLRLIASDFRNDVHQLEVLSATYDPLSHTTQLTVRTGAWSGDQNLRNRIVKAGDHWGVIRHAAGSNVTIWGKHPEAKSVTIYPTFTRR